MFSSHLSCSRRLLFGANRQTFGECTTLLQCILCYVRFQRLVVPSAKCPPGDTGGRKAHGTWGLFAYIVCFRVFLFLFCFATVLLRECETTAVTPTMKRGSPRKEVTMSSFVSADRSLSRLTSECLKFDGTLVERGTFF